MSICMGFCHVAGLATAPKGNQPQVLEMTGNMFYGAFAVAVGNVSVVATELINFALNQVPLPPRYQSRPTEKPPIF